MSKPIVKVKIVIRNIDMTIVQPMCEKSWRFCQIAKSQTLDDMQIYHIQKLGFDIELVR